MQLTELQTSTKPPLELVEGKSNKTKKQFSTEKGVLEIITDYVGQDTPMIQINLKLISLTERQTEEILKKFEVLL